MKKIELSQGFFATVEDADFEMLSRHTWCWSNGYAMSRINGHNESMHRVLMRPLQGEYVDHINGDGIDNRRENLRLCTKRQNHLNSQKCRTKKTSQFKGVHFRKDVKLWRASIKVNYKNIHLGYFKDEADAAKAYNEAAKIHFGEFARPNAVKD